MIVIGFALLLFSVSDILNPRSACQDDLDVGGVNVLVLEPAHCTDTFEIAPSSYGFILTILAICLLAFGAAILNDHKT